MVKLNQCFIMAKTAPIQVVWMPVMAVLLLSLGTVMFYLKIIHMGVSGHFLQEETALQQMGRETPIPLCETVKKQSPWETGIYLLV